MYDIMNLQRKYYNSEEHIGTQKSYVSDPITVKSKGALQRKKMKPKQSDTTKTAIVQLMMRGIVR